MLGTRGQVSHKSPSGVGSSEQERTQHKQPVLSMVTHSPNLCESEGFPGTVGPLARGLAIKGSREKGQEESW